MRSLLVIATALLVAPHSACAPPPPELPPEGTYQTVHCTRGRANCVASAERECRGYGFHTVGERIDGTRTSLYFRCKPFSGKSSSPSEQKAIFHLSGDWSGDYGTGHGPQLIRISQQGNRIVARKITGDNNVPAGKPTFTADLIGPESSGRGVIADRGFQNPKTVQGRLYVHSAESISFEWEGGGKVTFQKVDPPEFVAHESSRERTFALPGRASAQVQPQQDGAPSHSPPSRADIVSWATPSLVYIRTDRGEGSGFSIGYGVVTNFHVVRGAQQILVISAGLNAQKVRVINAFDQDRDLAILEVDDRIPPVQFANVAPRVGEDLLVMGYPLGLEVGIDTPTLTRGVMSAWRGDYIQFDAAVAPGSSGGPVFNEWGEVVGVATLKHQHAEGFALAVPSTLLRRLFENPDRMTVEQFGRITSVR